MSGGLPRIYQAALLGYNERGDPLYGVLRPDGDWRPGLDGRPAWHVRQADAEHDADELNRIHQLVPQPQLLVVEEQPPRRHTKGPGQ